MHVTGWIKKPTRGQSGAMMISALLFAVVSYNLYFCCQIKQRELEEKYFSAEALEKYHRSAGRK